MAPNLRDRTRETSALAPEVPQEERELPGALEEERTRPPDVRNAAADAGSSGEKRARRPSGCSAARFSRGPEPRRCGGSVSAERAADCQAPSN